jgi:hypothetical protein
MKRFLLEVVAFLAAQLLVAFAVQATYHRVLGEGHYLAAFADKARLLETTPPPRVLLVGGSSLAFGVNSAAIARVFGRPVVNLGLHAGLGLELMLSQAERALGPGDLVVVSPEYVILGEGLPLDSITVWQQVATVPGSVRDLPLSAWPRLLDDGLMLPRQRLNALWDYSRYGRPGSLYWREGFNSQGDFVGHLEKGTQEAGGQRVGVPTVEAAGDACERLARFARFARARGAEVVVTPPPIPEDDRELQAEARARLWQAVGQRAGLTVIEDAVIPRALFFDSGYHLAREGRRRRTAAIVRGVRESGLAPGHR